MTTAAPLPAKSTSPQTLGVYVHFPYCLTKCPYCDFLSIPTGGDSIPHAEYADAVLAELEERAPALQATPIHSVFFGGGTPSLWRPSELGRVLAGIFRHFERLADGVEVTVECNPGSFDERIASGLLEAGVNRISLGVQSLDSERLQFLGRRHDAEQGLEAIEVALRAGFSNVSADLIFGVRGQTPAEAEREAARVADTGVCHLSAYALTIEPGTQFGELARRGRLPLLPEEDVAIAFESIRAALESRGFAHYEISNYAKSGARARHNLGYWRGEPYLGLGVGAWGTLPASTHKVRYRNTPSLERYMGARGAGATSLDEVGERIAVLELITPDIDLSERLMLGLRLEEGVDLAALQAETGAPGWTPERLRAVTKWSASGALSVSDGRIRLEKRHWLVADAVIRELL